MKQIAFIIVLLMTLPASAFASHKYLENEYQQVWCKEQHGQMEYRLDDGTRVDCLTKTHAVEFDFAYKWAESVGQALYYAMKTGKGPGVVLILEDDYDVNFFFRLLSVAELYGITVWTMDKDDLKK